MQVSTDPGGLRARARLAFKKVDGARSVPRRLALARPVLEDILTQSPEPEVRQLMDAALSVKGTGAAAAAAQHGALFALAAAPGGQLLASAGLKELGTLSYADDQALASRPLLKGLVAQADPRVAPLADWAMHLRGPGAQAKAARLAFLAARDEESAGPALAALSAVSEKSEFEHALGLVSGLVDPGLFPVLEAVRQIPEDSVRRRGWKMIQRAVDQNWTGQPVELCRRAALEIRASEDTVDGRLAGTRPLLRAMAHHLGDDRRAALLDAVLEPMSNRRANSMAVGLLLPHLETPLRAGQEYAMVSGILEQIQPLSARSALAHNFARHLGIDVPRGSSVEQSLKAMQAAAEVGHLARALDSLPEQAVDQQDNWLWVGDVPLPVCS